MSRQHDEPVLIVDDNARNIQVLGAILSQEGFLVNVARSGQQALETAQRSHPGLVLLDVMMPDMDGYETCQRLKAIAELQETPVIFLTARTGKEAAVKGFAVGGVDYVTKPFDADELLARVRTQMELRRKTQLLMAAYADLRQAHAAQERLQQELLEAERLKTLLETAGGVAHEINQPLQALTSQLELQLADLPADDPQRASVTCSLDQVHRIDRIVQRMQSVAAYRSKPYAAGRRIVDFGGGSGDLDAAAATD